MTLDFDNEDFIKYKDKFYIRIKNLWYVFKDKSFDVVRVSDGEIICELNRIIDERE